MSRGTNYPLLELPCTARFSSIFSATPLRIGNVSAIAGCEARTVPRRVAADRPGERAQEQLAACTFGIAWVTRGAVASSVTNSTFTFRGSLNPGRSFDGSGNSPRYLLNSSIRSFGVGPLDLVDERLGRDLQDGECVFGASVLVELPEIVRRDGARHGAERVQPAAAWK